MFSGLSPLPSNASSISILSFSMWVWMDCSNSDRVISIFLGPFGPSMTSACFSRTDKARLICSAFSIYSSFLLARSNPSPVASLYLLFMIFTSSASKSFPPSHLSPRLVITSTFCASISQTVTSKVPPPRSKTSTFPVIFFTAGKLA